MTVQIAIVGAGPSGCFLGQALLKARPDLSVDIIDALPVPYGLVRYGVAPDHQGTKAITRQFERLFERQGAKFIGNLSIGRDIGLDDLRQAYDVVVLAAGLATDKTIGIAGEDLEGVVGAGVLTRSLYDHPDEGALPDINGNVVIMGNGNVAIDLLRLLAKTKDELAGSDLSDTATDWLMARDITSITIVGRSGAAAAKFDPVMVKELAKLQNVKMVVQDLGTTNDAQEQLKLDALTEVNGIQSGTCDITFRFGLTPKEVLGQNGKVTAVDFENSQGEIVSLPCDSFVTAIGFQASGPLERDNLIAQATDAQVGVLAPQLYATGWFRRGPRGTIPENRADAKSLADRILADLDSVRVDGSKPGAAAITKGRETISYAQWKQIDAVELNRAATDRCRAKISERKEMLAIARSGEE